MRHESNGYGVDGRILAARRKELGLSLQDVGNRLGVTRFAVHRWENGSRPIAVRWLLPWAEMLGVSPSATFRVPTREEGALTA